MKHIIVLIEVINKGNVSRAQEEPDEAERGGKTKRSGQRNEESRVLEETRDIIYKQKINTHIIYIYNVYI